MHSTYRSTAYARTQPMHMQALTLDAPSQSCTRTQSRSTFCGAASGRQDNLSRVLLEESDRLNARSLHTGAGTILSVLGTKTVSEQQLPCHCEQQCSNAQHVFVKRRYVSCREGLAGAAAVHRMVRARPTSARRADGAVTWQALRHIADHPAPEHSQLALPERGHVFEGRRRRKYL